MPSSAFPGVLSSDPGGQGLTTAQVPPATVNIAAITVAAARILIMIMFPENFGASPYVRNQHADNAERPALRTLLRHRHLETAVNQPAHLKSVVVSESGVR